MTIAKKKRKPLPHIGPIAYYLSVRNGYPSIVGVTGELRLIARATMRVMRGEFDGVDRFYAAIRKDGRNFLTAAGVAFFGAIGSNDPVLFDAVIKDIAAYPSRYGTPEAKFAAEIVMVWIRIYLRVPMTYPEWIVNLDLASVPCEWRYQVSNLAVEYLHQKGEYEAASILADVLLNLEPEKIRKSSTIDIFLKMEKARLCRETGRMDEAARWCRETVECAKLRGVILPFLGGVLGPKSALERVLAAEAPELLAKIKKLTNGYFRNRVKYHNRYARDSVSEDLRPREFYIAHLLKHGVRYKEIAERTGMSEGRVRNMVSEIYDILHIRNAAEIGGLVW